MVLHPSSTLRRRRPAPRRPNTALEQAGIRRKGLGVHSLRHTAATKWAVGNVLISEIAAILGQSTLSVTEMYIHAEQYTKGVTDSFNLK